MLARRALLFAPLLALAPTAVLVPRARAQALDDDALKQLIGFFTASASMTGLVAVSVARLKPSSFKRSERGEVATELNRMAIEMEQLMTRQMVMTATIGDYVSSVRSGGFKAETHEPMWRGLNGMIRDVAQRVDFVYTLQREAKWAKVALTPAQDAALRDTLVGKQSILFQLQYLPAPSLPAQIDALAVLDQRYIDLMKKQYDLRVALSQAAKRFGSPQQPT